MRKEIVRACISAVMILAVCARTEEEEKLYIVHMDKSQMPSTFLSHDDWYKSVLLSVADVKRRGDLDRKLVYTYYIVMDGFSALLTSTELDAVRALPGYVRSHEDKGDAVLHTEDLKQRWEWVPQTRYGRRLQTTRSYEFLGLSENKGLWPKSEFGDANQIVVGVIDTGIWPESPSFVEDGMGPLPAKWNGTCQPGVDFDNSVCNRKLIGARYFNRGFLASGKKVDSKRDYNSTRDWNGHGTFVTSIIAGQETPHANAYDYGIGIAKGMAPHVRVAMYKVVWYDSITLGNIYISNCDILSAMDQAIADGVDIISISLDASSPTDSWLDDPIVFGSLKAIQNGVFVVASGGNEGPKVATIRNDAPWLLTVGATTIDRAFLAMINFGDGHLVMKGTSLYRDKFSTPNLILISGYTCVDNTLDPRYVKGNILFCEDSTYVNVDTRVRVATATGAIAAIIAYDDAVDLPTSIYSMPVVFVNANQTQYILEYLNTTTTPIASLQFHITELDYTPAPLLGSFSSVGPSLRFPDIVKPDLVAPGVNIVGACRNKRRRRRRKCFRLSSGTSAAAPHVAGVAALLKAVHPDWSPAAIKSALMTTASRIDNIGELIKPANRSAPALTALDVGCGHIKPELAANPGLVYDLGYQDYVNYLCLTDKKNDPECANASGSPNDLNLATFAANFFQNPKAGETEMQSFKRVLTNLGGGKVVYKSIAFMDEGVNVRVTPDTLVFNQTNQKLEFTLTLEIVGPSLVTERVREGFLIWYDGADDGVAHEVFSPLVAIFPNNN